MCKFRLKKNVKTAEEELSELLLNLLKNDGVKKFAEAQQEAFHKYQGIERMKRIKEKYLYYKKLYDNGYEFSSEQNSEYSYFKFLVEDLYKNENYE